MEGMLAQLETHYNARRSDCYTLRQCQDKGNYMVAARDINKDELILVEEPTGGESRVQLTVKPDPYSTGTYH